MWFCLPAQPCEQSRNHVSSWLTRAMLVETEGALGESKKSGLRSGLYSVHGDGESHSL